MSKPEIQIARILTDTDINFKQEKTFPNLRWRGPLRFDFYLPNQNILIEYDGEAHFSPIYGTPKLRSHQEKDRVKNAFCLAHGIPLYRIPYWKLEVIESFEDMTDDTFRVRCKTHNDRLTPPSNKKT